MPNAAYRRIVVLTGAGISAESGIATFRDKEGLWAKHDINEVATPEGYARNPAKVHAFYNQRRMDVRGVEPNTAHMALAGLEQQLDRRGAEVLVVTQNVDPLHERAGTQRLIHMHGELLRVWCVACDARLTWDQELSTSTVCGSRWRQPTLRSCDDPADHQSTRLPSGHRTRPAERSLRARIVAKSAMLAPTLDRAAGSFWLAQMIVERIIPPATPPQTAARSGSPVRGGVRGTGKRPCSARG